VCIGSAHFDQCNGRSSAGEQQCTDATVSMASSQQQRTDAAVALGEQQRADAAFTLGEQQRTDATVSLVKGETVLR
jgi:hypothetical protein